MIKVTDIEKFAELVSQEGKETLLFQKSGGNYILIWQPGSQRILRRPAAEKSRYTDDKERSF